MERIDNESRLTILRLDAEIRACRHQIAVKQLETKILLAQQEEWKSKYQEALEWVLERQGVDLTKFVFDDETGELTPVQKG